MPPLLHTAGLRIRLGTRASLLAQWQANWVAARLRELGVEVELVPVVTSGDQQQQTPFGGGGDTGWFTKEIQQELLAGRIDLAVHSLKDLPTAEVPGLALAAVPERAPVGDALVSTKHHSLDDLPPGAVVGTGSLRRRAQLLHVRPDLRTSEIRGNVDTRLKKLDRGDYDAILLAEAGLRRLGFGDRITQVLPLSLALPAVGQGALGLETRDDDEAVRQAVAALDHAESHQSVLAERAMLSALRGGCLAPIAAHARVEAGRLRLTGRVLSLDGTRNLEAEYTAEPAHAAILGRQVAEDLLGQGAADLINAAGRHDAICVERNSFRLGGEHKATE
jgi:hydroxymethylbilane synthase